LKPNSPTESTGKNSSISNWNGSQDFEPAEPDDESKSEDMEYENEDTYTEESGLDEPDEYY
jgi:hypothetical protein